MIRVVCRNGTDIELVDAESGEDISKGLSIAYGGKIALDQPVTAELTLQLVGVDITPSRVLWQTRNPLSGELEPLKAIEFDDGTRLEFAHDGAVTIVAPSR